MIKMALAQLNTTPKSVAANAVKIAESWNEAQGGGADICFTPEQSLSGYPLEDMAANPDVLRACQIALNRLLDKSRDMPSALGVGLPERGKDGKVYNTYVVIHQGKIIHRQHKHDLPNDDVFDEKRIYGHGSLPQPLEFMGHRIGIPICEDGWHPEVAAALREQGAEFLVSVNASPFYAGKPQFRLSGVAGKRIGETGLPMAYLNQVGGVDEIVFDGHSFAMNMDGSIAMQGRGFQEELNFLDVGFGSQGAFFRQAVVQPFESELSLIYQALVLGTRDYVGKSGFKKVLLGASGGIDSGLVAPIAVDALGPDNVHLVLMPSKYSSEHSIADAEKTARLLGCSHEIINIQGAVDALSRALVPSFSAVSNPAAIGLAEENIQARTRGVILMGLSNAIGAMLLSTGNKSEMAVGYATLYGDMNGGFNPLKDVFKMMVYGLAEWRNANRPDWVLGPNGLVVPENTIRKKPSAELKPGQFDENSLPPYPVLDAILEAYVEHDMPAHEIARITGQGAALVNGVIEDIDRAEYKRRQAPPGVKITPRAFGKGRRVPIVGASVPGMSAQVMELTFQG